MLTAAAEAGAFIAISRIVLLVNHVATVANVAVTSASARVEIVVAGWLLVFRSSSGLDPSKSVYLPWLGVGTALAIAVIARLNVLGLRRFGMPRTIRFVGVALPVASGLATTIRHRSPTLSATRRLLGFTTRGGGLFLFTRWYPLASGLNSRIGHRL